MDEKIRVGGETLDKKKLHQEWLKRKNQAEKDRKQHLTQIKVNRKFAAGKQHLRVNRNDGRVIDRYKDNNGVKLVTADILTQYLLTAVGKMAANDYRPNFLVSSDDEVSENVTKQLNLAFGWGWENEWDADRKILALWRLLVIDGTAAIRCRYDRKLGDEVGLVPYKNGKPILEEDERRSYVAEEAAAGRTATLKMLREGKVVWEILTAENLLPPPNIDDPKEFPWEIVVRPISVELVKDRYPEETKDLEPEDIESSGALTAGVGTGEAKVEVLENHVFVYTGYLRPTPEWPKGMTVIFTNDRLLEARNHLPYADHPRGPSTGLHYFRWQILPGRFWGKAFIENGIGPQQVRNKRLTQIDTIIDRNLPKTWIEEGSLAIPRTGEPNEIIPIRSGAPLPKTEQGVPPGAWMLQDVKLQEENAEKAMGMRSISMGAPPAGVSAYSAMALLTENDSLKFDAIAQEFRLEMLDLSWDSVEAMRNWPPGKQLLIAGAENRLQAIIWDRNYIPESVLARPPRGGSLPRSQAAELQKINDIFAVIRSSPMFQKDPERWVNWYVESLNTGKPQDFPPSLGDQQAHKAELENITMTQTLQTVPVAEYDDDIRHVELHRAFQVPLRALADQGDELAMQQVEVLEEHIREHLAMAETEAQNLQPQGQTAPPEQAPPPTPQAMGGLQGPSPLPSLEQQVGMEAQLGRPI